MNAPSPFDDEDFLTFETEPAAPSDNKEIRAFTARLLAWIERETDAAVRYVESENFALVLPRGRSRLVDLCMTLETRAAVDELSTTVFLSLS